MSLHCNVPSHLNILAIETSSEACSCALQLSTGEQVQRYQEAPRQHTTLLLPMVESLLHEAAIALSAVDCFAFGRGPGSFTGVRIAAAAIQGLALSVDRPVVAVSSLAALAARCAAGDSVLAAFDARMNEVYFAGYQLDANRIPVEIRPEQLSAPEQLDLPAKGDWIALGQAWSVYAEPLNRALNRCGEARLIATQANILPDAGQVARLGQMLAQAGEGLRAEQALPQYLRREVATPRRARAE